MGKNLSQQRRGKGNPRYRSPSHRYPGKASYASIPNGAKEGVVTDIIDAPGKRLPLAEVDYDGTKVFHVPHDGITVGQPVKMSSIGQGNIARLIQIPEGYKIYNIELRPGDGGKMCRSSGSFALLVSREGKKVTVMLPSKKNKVMPGDCRATIGVAAGGGRTDKPLMKAGNMYYAKKALGKFYATSSGTARNAVDHPFGGSNLGKHKTVSRDRPPGRKVGSISPRRTGKKK